VLGATRATIALNGTNIDDTDIANGFANAQVYAGADRSWYNGAGSFAALVVLKTNNLPSGTAYGTSNPNYMLGDVCRCSRIFFCSL